MAEVLRLADVIVPEIFSKYLIQESIKKTGLYKSGILQMDKKISDMIAGGGTTFNIPFWNRLTGEVQAMQSNTEIQTKKASVGQMTARRLLFADGWSAEELASALSGEDPMDAIASMVDKYWEEQQQQILFSVIKGIIANNEANYSGDLVNNIHVTSSPAASNLASAEAIIESYALVGDAGDFSAIAMHSVPYYNLAKKNLIEFEPDNVQNIGFGTFMGMSVIVTDEIAPTMQTLPVYWSILFKQGAIGYGESDRGITPVEVDRNAKMSEDLLFTRRQFCMHPQGFKWSDSSVAGQMPTKAELALAANWDRVYNAKNCGFVVLKSNG